MEKAEIRDLLNAAASFQAIRSSGPGGQHANKVATGIEARLDLRNSNLPEQLRKIAENKQDGHMTSDGVIVVKATRYRSQVRNRKEALQRLTMIVQSLMQESKYRKPTAIPAHSKRKRRDDKRMRSRLKAMRRSPLSD